MTSSSPWLSVAANGEVAVTWLDRRNDPDNVNYDSYATGSTNGGTSFLTNLKLTSVMSNPFDDGFGGGFMGDYTGNAVAGSTLCLMDGYAQLLVLARLRGRRQGPLELRGSCSKDPGFSGPFLVSAINVTKCQLAQYMTVGYNNAIRWR